MVDEIKIKHVDDLGWGMVAANPGYICMKNLSPLGTSSSPVRISTHGCGKHWELVSWTPGMTENVQCTVL